MRLSDKHVKPMWVVEGVLFHYNDRERAERQAKSIGMEERLVYVGVNNNDFISTSQLIRDHSRDYTYWMFESEEEAEYYVSKYNK